MSASIDSNGTRTLTCALNTDGLTVTRVKATSNALNISNGTTGTDHGQIDALRDENDSPTLIAVSSSTTTVNGVSYVQGVTPVVVYADSSGNLLTDTT